MLMNPEPLPAPTTCPFCGSSKIATASQKADVSAYWRCEICGEMWNVGRLQTRHNDGLRRQRADKETIWRP